MAIAGLALSSVIKEMVIDSKKIRRLMREHDLQPNAVGGSGQERQRPR